MQLRQEKSKRFEGEYVHPPYSIQNRDQILIRNKCLTPKIIVI
jgi:hypothetical protein